MIELPKGIYLKDLLLFLRNIGLRSSSILRDYENGIKPLYENFDVLPITFNPNNPVTAADLTINQLIIEAFSSNYFGIEWEIVSEENAKSIELKNLESEWRWLIDPLDGTKDFIQNTGEYAIHIALIYRNSPILGMVALPSIKEIWFGVDGYGTWKENETNTSEIKNFICPSKMKGLDIVTSKNHSNQKLNYILDYLEHRKILKMGSIGFKICNLLRNESNVYISISDKTSPKDWDIAAPHALLKGANCNFTYVSGVEINYLKKNFEQPGCLIGSTLPNNEHMKVCKKIGKIIEELNL